MDEFDLYEALREKTAEVNPQVVGAAIGALATIGMQYVASKAPKGGRSSQQMAADKRERDAKADLANTKAQGKKPGMMQEASVIATRANRELSDLAAKHPLKSAISTAPFGAYLGSQIAKHVL